MRHTKGPWKVSPRLKDDDSSLQLAICDSHGCIAWAVNRATVSDTANAQLISAAPDLFNALITAINLYEDGDASDIDAMAWLEEAKSAIEKARGDNL